MADYYAKSSDISVFPMAVNRAVRPTDNTLSERNLASLITSIVDKDSFVVSKGEDLRFVIGGYHFVIYELVNFLSANSSWSNIYATVQIDISNKDVPYLKGVDTETSFTGVKFSDVPGSDANKDVGGTRYRTLHLLQKVDGEWIVPSESSVKFDQNSIGGLTVDIDGGEIE